MSTPSLGVKWLASLAVTVVTVLSACAGEVPSAPPTPHRWTGAVVTSAPVAKPDVTLTDQTGQPYNLRQRTAGKLTLLYFGYTHCPDACPTTMATLALALRRMADTDRAQVAVVFITTDPARDTPAVLKPWLARFDASFTGLTGSNAQVIQAQVVTHLPVTAAANTPSADGGYTVDHASFVMAFTPADDVAHIVYPGGVNADSEAADFTELINRGWHQ